MKNPHVPILYALFIVAIAVALFALNPAGQGRWQCSQVACSKFISPDEWRSNNCFMTQINEQDQEVCRVDIDCKNQLVSAGIINFSALAQCMEFRCVQEVMVRNANYTINMTTQAAK